MQRVIFPDTYHVVKGTKVSDVLLLSQRVMAERLAYAWQQKSLMKLATPEELLILASIIEKESAEETDRRTISQVFHNRLRLNMRLQTDPTVIYALGDNFDGDIRSRDLRVESPFTYRVRSTTHANRATVFEFYACSGAAFRRRFSLLCCAGRWHFAILANLRAQRGSAKISGKAGQVGYSNASKDRKFITLEGSEGVGKTTNMDVICELLESRNIPLFEPENRVVALAEALREAMLTPREEQVDGLTELLIVFAAHAAPRKHQTGFKSR